MTRENKLALVIGFGLILLVGILISDHFSTARSQESAQLTRVVDPLIPPRPDQADLIAFRAKAVPFNPNPPAVEPAPHGPAGDRIDDRRIGLALAEAEALPYRFHDVRRGESLTSICQDRYGDPTLALELALYNDLDDPDDLYAGHRLRIPDAETLVRGRPGGSPRGSSPAAAPASTPTAGPRTYTVKDGDMLSEIAARLLGSAGRYEEIFEMNRDLMTSPDVLVLGMTLRIPPATGN